MRVEKIYITNDDISFHTKDEALSYEASNEILEIVGNEDKEVWDISDLVDFLEENARMLWPSLKRFADHTPKEGAPF